MQRGRRAECRTRLKPFAPTLMNDTEFDLRVLSMKDSIFRLAMSMLGCRAEAEDATQDILEKLWRQRGGLGRYGNVEAFVYTSARNSCIDRIRGRNVRLVKTEDIAHENPRTADISHGIEMKDTKEVLERIIAALPEKQQLAIHLRDVEEMEFAEIAEITGMDEANVRVSLSRARKTVREELTRLMDYGVKHKQPRTNNIRI